MKTERKLTCIVCPRGCAITVSLKDGVPLDISGNACPRGHLYAETECTHPTRTLCSTVRTADGRVLAVKTAAPIPKELLFQAMAVIDETVAPKNARIGDVLVPDLLGTGVALVASEDA